MFASDSAAVEPPRSHQEHITIAAESVLPDGVNAIEAGISLSVHRYCALPVMQSQTVADKCCWFWLQYCAQQQNSQDEGTGAVVKCLVANNQSLTSSCLGEVQRVAASALLLYQPVSLAPCCARCPGFLPCLAQLCHVATKLHNWLLTCWTRGSGKCRSPACYQSAAACEKLPCLHF